MSNVTGFQYGNNNYMQVDGKADTGHTDRRRHPTAPSRVNFHMPEEGRWEKFPKFTLAWAISKYSFRCAVCKMPTMHFVENCVIFLFISAFIHPFIFLIMHVFFLLKHLLFKLMLFFFWFILKIYVKMCTCEHQGSLLGLCLSGLRSHPDAGAGPPGGGWVWALVLGLSVSHLYFARMVSLRLKTSCTRESWPIIAHLNEQLQCFVFFFIPFSLLCYDRCYFLMPCL